MIPVTVDEIATVLGAQLSGRGDTAAVINALTADSRTVIPGALFVALRGERVDGHDYVATAAAAGAADQERPALQGRVLQHFHAGVEGVKVGMQDPQPVGLARGQRRAAGDHLAGRPHRISHAGRLPGRRDVAGAQEGASD